MRKSIVSILSVSLLLIIVWGAYSLQRNRRTQPVILDPYLSNTYQFVTIANLAQIDLGRHEQRTIQWINQSAQVDGSFVMKDTTMDMENPEDLLDSIYYAALTLNELGQPKLPYHQESVEIVQNLQMQNGAFSQIAGKDGGYWKKKDFSNDSLQILDLTNTYRALITLDLLEASALDRDACIQWLTNLWTDLMQEQVLPYNKIPDDTLPHLNTILYALFLLDAGIEELPEFDTFMPRFQDERLRFQNTEILTGSVLYDAYWIQDVSQLLNLPPVDLSQSFIPALISHQHKDGGFDLYFQPHSESVGTHFALELIVEAGEPIPQREKLVSLVEKHKARPGGFSLIAQYGTE